MRLETERLLIRDFTEADFDAVYAYGSDPEVVRYMRFPSSTPEGTREHLARCMALAREQPRRWYDLGIVLKLTGQLIGGITLDVFDRSDGEAAFSIARRGARSMPPKRSERSCASALSSSACAGLPIAAMWKIRHQDA